MRTIDCLTSGAWGAPIKDALIAWFCGQVRLCWLDAEHHELWVRVWMNADVERGWVKA